MVAPVPEGLPASQRPAHEPDAAGGTGRWRQLLSARGLIFVLVTAVVAYLALGPLLYLVYGTFTDGNGFTLQFVEDTLNDPSTDFSATLVNTVVFAIGTSAVATFFGVVLAFLVARTDTPFKSLIVAVSLIPMIIPGVLHTIAWILLAGRVGFLNNVAGFTVFDVYSMQGMVLVQGLHTAPLVFLLVLPAFRSMDPSLEEAAMTSGAKPLMVLAKITAPLMRPALYASLLIAFVTAVEAFEVPQLLGRQAGIDVVTSHIWDSLHEFPPAYGDAGVYSVLLLTITIIGVMLYSRLLRRGKQMQTVTGKGFRARTIPLGKFRWIGGAFALLYFLLAVIAPVGILAYASFQPTYQPPSWDNLANSTWQNYHSLLESDSVLGSARNSLVLGLGSATAVMLLMAVVAWMIIRGNQRGRSILDGLATSPLAVPSLVLGVALIFIYLRAPLPIYGTMWILFIAYLTRYMPYGIRFASSSMHQIGSELEEAAQMAGATWVQTFRRINLPLLLPGLVAGWIFIMIVSFRELSTSLLIYSPGNEVISIVIWDLYANGSIGRLSALGSVLLVGLLVLVILMQLVTRRFGRGLTEEAV